MREHWGVGIGHTYAHDEHRDLYQPESPCAQADEDAVAASSMADPDEESDPDDEQDVAVLEYAVYDREDELYESSEDVDVDGDEYHFE